MEDPAGMSLEPGHDLGMFVRAIVIEDRVDHFAGRHLTPDGIEKADAGTERPIGASTLLLTMTSLTDSSRE